MTTPLPLKPTRNAPRVLMGVLTCALICIGGTAQANGTLPAQFDGVDVKDKLGTQLDPTIPLIDGQGSDVTLGDFFDGKRPVLLTLNYFSCESLCSTQLNEVVKTLSKLEWTPGVSDDDEAFRVLSISFDPRDTPEVAKGKRHSYTQALVEGVSEVQDEKMADTLIQQRADTLAWDFLVAKPDSIRRLLDSTGYEVKFDKKSGQYAHAPVIFVLSPDGTISRYLWGLTYRKQDLKFSLMEASDGIIGTFGDKVLLSCFAFDEDSGAYSAFAWGFMRLGALVILIIIAVWLAIHWYRERYRRSSDEGDSSNGQSGLKTAETSR